MLKKYLKEILIIIFVVAFCFLLFYRHQDKRKHSNDIRQAVNVERLKTDAIRDNYEAMMKGFKDSINDLMNNQRPDILIKYKDRIKYIPITDTCGLCYAERDYLREDNNLLEKTVKYYANALTECDTQFMQLLRHSDSLIIAKNNIIINQADSIIKELESEVTK